MILLDQPGEDAPLKVALRDPPASGSSPHRILDNESHPPPPYVASQGTPSYQAIIVPTARIVQPSSTNKLTSLRYFRPLSIVVLIVFLVGATVRTLYEFRQWRNVTGQSIGIELSSTFC